MTTFDLNSINAALNDSGTAGGGVDFTGKSLVLNSASDAQPIVDAINACPNLHHLTLTGNTLGVEAAKAIAKALETHPELKICRWSDMFTGRMKSEIPLALSALGDGMIAAGARLHSLDLSDNAFGPIGVEGLATLLQSDVCSQLQELRLNNNGLGITGGRLLATALGGCRLRVFVAGRNRLENDAAGALARVLQQMGTLEELSMPQNGIYHAGIRELAAALERNPGLRVLNLNDNTIGPKGAPHIAKALPRLSQLRTINFGDCLLKTKGGMELANAIKQHSIQLESLDLSHNEMGREACAAVVDAVTHARGDTRLNRLVLAGNSLGGATNKQTMRDKLGDAAELSDGEGSDDQYVTDSDEEEDENTDASEQSSATEDAQHYDTMLDSSVVVRHITLDHSGVEEVETDVGRFLAQPTLDNLTRLGADAPDVIDAHLQSIKDPAELIKAYVQATLMVSGLCASNTARDIATRLYPLLLHRAGQQHAQSWLLANTMLQDLQLIKSENKDSKIRWDIASCYAVLADVIDAAYFPAPLRDTLRFFIASKMAAMTDEVREVVQKHPNLFK